MRTKSTEKANAIVEFVDAFFEHNRRSPSIREIEAGTGIPRPTVQRYLVDMDDKGQIEYDGSNIITEYIRRITTQNIVRLPISGAIPCGEPQSEEEWKGDFVEFPASLLGNGDFYILMADGDSMTDAGIGKGDYVIVRRTNSAEFGKIVVALDNEQRNTLKRLAFDTKTKRPYLHPENKKYNDIYPDTLSIQGVAEMVIKNLK
ncbi:MAG: helix-turn-helix domain-containing protein [Clostridiales bacterium]|nr:helix-turn-helix domain-containing protein [Candidatus Cacconaster stercorequi]